VVKVGRVTAPTARVLHAWRFTAGTTVNVKLLTATVSPSPLREAQLEMVPPAVPPSTPFAVTELLALSVSVAVPDPEPMSVVEPAPRVDAALVAMVLAGGSAHLDIQGWGSVAAIPKPPIPPQFIEVLKRPKPKFVEREGDQDDTQRRWRRHCPACRGR
jgi:hypothetical protein